MSDQRFLVTARKYRPQRFAELVAQEHVTGTLKNAVRLDRLAHAYLFTGPRGVGKTTAARILAKAINCTAPLADRTDGAEPCRVCDSCRSFEEGRNLNIIEIDAASNNKVDDVRDLRETVRIPPQGARKKVYIVDEVHMLTTQAFNALLKTLEEPPPHVLFIFATTEPHKVLPTIQSRCQRFDFRRIPVPDIVEQLRSICVAESIRSDDGSLVLLARRGDGALRDALSVFDQAVSLCGEDLTLDELSRALGIVSEDLYFDATDCIAAADTSGMLRLVDRIVRSGYDLLEFLDGLAEHTRNLLVALTMPDPELIEASLETRERYVRHASSFSEPQLLRLLALVDRALEELRVSRQPRLRLELALLQMASLPTQVDLRNVLARIDTLAGAPAATPRPAPSQPAPKPVATPPPAPKPVAAPLPSPQPVATPTPAPKSVAAPLPSPQPVAPQPVAPPTPTQQPVSEPQPVADPPPAPTPRPTTHAPGATRFVADEEDELNDAPWIPPAGPSLFDSSPAPAAPAAAPKSAPVSKPMGSLGAPALRLEKPKSPDGPKGSATAVVTEDEAPETDHLAPPFWNEFVDSVKEARIRLGALLTHAVAFLAPDGTVVMGVPDEFHIRAFRDEKEVLEQALVAVSGGTTRTFRTFLLAQERDRDNPDAVAVDPQEAVKALCEKYPAMRALMERFGGEIVW